MDSKTINELGGALHRVAELSKKAIIEVTDANEKRALEAYITSVLCANAEELISCWIVVQNEYRPLLQGLAGALGTVLQIINARNQQTTQAAPKPQGAGITLPPEAKATATATGTELSTPSTPDNVVTLKQP